MLSEKQKRVKNVVIKKNPFIVINDGSIRSGKSFLNHFFFARHVNKYRGQRVQFILTGETMGTLERNVLEDFRNIFGFRCKLDQHNRFELFGNVINCFGTDTKESYGKITGFTAHGAYLNEATLSNFNAVQETIGRCSGAGALILMDCNPDNPKHPLKTEFIDKADGERVLSFSWKLEDNAKINGGVLDPEYISNLKATIPPGFWYNRKILGQWTGAEGLCFSEFDQDRHVIDHLPASFNRYVCGVDWGYKHYGVILVAGVSDGKYYILEEIAETGKPIEWWIDQKKKIDAQYSNPVYYCDTARPEYVEAFRGKLGNKAVGPGIATVNEAFRDGSLFIKRGAAPLLEKQSLGYVWSNSAKDEPVKKDDDAPDALRYLMHSDKSSLIKIPAVGFSGRGVNKINW